MNSDYEEYIARYCQKHGCMPEEAKQHALCREVEKYYRGKSKPPPAPKYQKAPRHSWQHYGITKERYRQLTEYIQFGRYAHIASQAAHRANKDIAEYILLSIKKNLSYEGLEKLWGRGEIERIPYCRTDFYGIRRYFYSIMDKELRRLGK